MQTLSDVLSIAKRLLVTQGEIYPTLIIEGTKGVNLQLYPELPGDEKAKVLEALGFAVAAENKIGDLLQVFQMCEVYLSSTTIPPSKDPKRIEAVFVCQITVTNNKRNFATYEQVRNEKGELIELRSVNSPGLDKNTVISPFIDALIAGFQRGRLSGSHPPKN